MRNINCRDQQFRIVITTSDPLDVDLRTVLYIDGERISRHYFRAGRRKSWGFRGIRSSATTMLPFKFQELELVGMYYKHSLNIMFVPDFIICY
jgi:hypothetical protein